MTSFPPPPESVIDKLDQAAWRLAEALERFQCQLVLAESCTAGLAAALLGGVPGISRWLCGSAVVYQEQTKQHWLDVPQALLDTHTAVAPEVADCLARSVLVKTPQADLAAAIVGHLGPDAPEEADGMVYVAIQFRGGPVQRCECRLPRQTGSEDPRRDRQRLAAAFIIEAIGRAVVQAFQPDS